MSTYKLAYTGQQIDAGLDAAFAAAPQSTTYTKAQTDALITNVSGIAETGDDYIELKSGVRLYITDTTPTGTIPTGSVGIGF